MNLEVRVCERVEMFSMYYVLVDMCAFFVVVVARAFLLQTRARVVKMVKYPRSKHVSSQQPCLM